jgi:predicted nucleic acid-binding protein
MRIVVDTNIVFSAILNTNSKIGKILLHPGRRFNFYSTQQLLNEIEEHRVKLILLSGYSENE